MRVLMYPEKPGKLDNGISQVIHHYIKYSKDFGIDYVSEGQEHDLVAIHAGMVSVPTTSKLVAHIHGLYWTGDRQGHEWEWKANRNVVDSIRHADLITVPSTWVAMPFKRDMHLSPIVIPHGVEWAEWQHSEQNQGFVLWNKNRQTITCDPEPMNRLAERFPSVRFVSTFGQPTQNVKTIGKIPFDEMKRAIQQCGVYLATTRETGGIGIMEAMAAGKPILGYATGAIVDIVQHGINGYLAIPGSIEDLAQGLVWCYENYKVLSDNSTELAKDFDWKNTVRQISQVYEQAIKPGQASASIIIPCYNYEKYVGRAIQSAINQTYAYLENIIVVDDGSTEDIKSVVSEFSQKDNRVKYIRQDNSGVAIARNKGIEQCGSKYICCLDADDSLEPQYLGVCISALENDNSVGMAYTRLRITDRTGELSAKKASKWPSEFDFDLQLQAQNQVPTACVFRRGAWERLGGYRARFAPKGCGTEDANLWLRMGAIGYSGLLVDDRPLFIYSYGGNTTGDGKYKEIDWTTTWHPWTYDNLHPFASVATPKQKSHPVRSYENPIVSVVIPVGPGHEDYVINALDSLEAQTIRNWECIVAWDSPDIDSLEKHKKAYPFVTWVETGGTKGAGYARNRGAELAKGALLLFLDADDWLYPEMLELVIQEYRNVGGNVAVYTNAVGKIFIDTESAKKAPQDKVLFHNPDTQETIITRRLEPYQWEMAQRQPVPRAMYIWCYISTLHPKAWFDEIGGFDEQMPSWEDWDYWIRMAHRGKEFVHLDQELLVYPDYTGNRRSIGTNQETAQQLINYMTRKYEGVQMVPCRTCASKQTTTTIRRVMPTNPLIQQQTAQSFSFDDQMVLILYQSSNRGDHRVIGHFSFPERISGLSMVRDRHGGWRIDYKYHASGDRFLVHRNEIQVAQHIFKPIAASVPEVSIAEQRKQVLPTAPIVPTKTQKDAVPMLSKIADERDFDLQTIPGIGGDLAAALKEDGIDMLQDILEIGVDGLMEYKGVGPKKAQIIVAAIEKRLGKE